MQHDSLQGEVQSALDDLFVIERELPRGGMSRVFVAFEKALKRRVVIKVLAPDLTASLSAERFRREIGLAARLQHPHIVPLLSSGLAGTHLYYTMPFVDGESLRERMTRERPMPISDVTTVLEAVARALAYAHEEGVVHRDIKPENVMFFHGQAVVLDFGIGKALMKATNSDSDQLRITQSGMSLGTPMYVAPEQAAGDPSLDHRADLYALGVVAYEMITGHPPFASRSPEVVIEAHATRKPEPIAARRPDVPKRLEATVMRMLEKRPADRPATGDDVVQMLGETGTTRISGRGPVVDTMASAPFWVPWTIAGVAMLVALLMTVLYLRR
ncbi:MAG: serine/threonine-protein kinase [Gemmatimonadota bacterium]